MEAKVPGEDDELLKRSRSARETFINAMDDDLDTGTASGVVLHLARLVNERPEIPSSTARSVFSDLCEYCSVLGLCEEELEADPGR